METVSPNQGSLKGENPRAALKLEIEGMHCAGCVSSVEKALYGLVGVETAEVNLPLKHGKVLYDPDRIEPGLIENAVRQAGFHPRRMLEQESIEQSLDSDQKALMETEKRFRIALIFFPSPACLGNGTDVGIDASGKLVSWFFCKVWKLAPVLSYSAGDVCWKGFLPPGSSQSLEEKSEHGYPGGIGDVGCLWLQSLESAERWRHFRTLF